jgi:hypothetical protein
LKAEVKNAILDNTVGGYIPPYVISEARPGNPRVHSEKQVRQIAQSIESFGFNVPLLIDDQQKVIASHGHLTDEYGSEYISGTAAKLGLFS